MTDWHTVRRGDPQVGDGQEVHRSGDLLRRLPVLQCQGAAGEHRFWGPRVLLIWQLYGHAPVSSPAATAAAAAVAAKTGQPRHCSSSCTWCNSRPETTPLRHCHLEAVHQVDINAHVLQAANIVVNI